MDATARTAAMPAAMPGINGLAARCACPINQALKPTSTEAASIGARAWDCTSNTQSSQAAVPYIGKASRCFSVSIQAPGLGNSRIRAGMKVTATNGAAKPRPRAVNIKRAAGALWVRAKPSAVAMNGAVQGAATTTASMPVKKAPARPPLAASDPPAPWPGRVVSNTPDMFSATSSMTKASAPTTAGDCSWKPQPIAAPPAFSASSEPASARKVASTPARNARPWDRASFSWWAWAARLAAFIDSTGNTQGIRLRISPPIRAKATAPRRPRFAPSGGMAGVAVACPAVDWATASAWTAAGVTAPRPPASAGIGSGTAETS